MKSNILIFTLCFSLICVSVIAQEELSKELTFQLLNSYQQQFQHDPDVGHIKKANLLKNQGINVEAFSRSLLQHEEFIDFRTEALYLLAAEKYAEDPVDLIQFLDNDLERNLGKNDLGYLMSNMQCLNIIQMMVGPNLIKDENVLNSIKAFANRLFQNTEMYKPDVWMEKMNLSHLGSMSKDQLTNEQKKNLNYPGAMANLAIQLASSMYYATGEQQYLDILQQATQSNDSAISSMANFLLSDQVKEGWKSGRYELFAHDRGLKNDDPYVLTQEEIQRRAELSQKARERSRERKKNN